ncbi:acetate--CoA ligase family protein [Noviherbaspirillum soli]|uniref:acetate--CoA ligase family protein n=1 Tax=Noviherbaspirillum soli TaxID=1064518 RepID=UPI00188B40B4|nr:acetate--CoA ligase family protein [Noviherbaspirillum soli]
MPAIPDARLGQALFSPRSIAIIGASDDPAKTSGRPVLFLRRAGFQGAIYPVNPRRDTVLGERAWPSVAALPEVPDHAYIVTPTELVLPALEECAAAGIKVASILANGFSEAGPEGLAREERLREICARTGIRVVGPNSLGVVNVHRRCMITANAAFAEPELPPGGIFVASHSGSMIGALVSRGKERGIGFAGLVSVGNEADLGIGEICLATLDDPDITGYLLFLETIRKGDRLREFALAAAARGKPVAAYKLGRSAAAAELAVSHTGALAGEDDVADTFLKDCGIARVETLEAFIECLPLMARMPLAHRKSPRVGVITTTGGGAAMVVDQLGMRGVQVETPSHDTFARLAAAGVKVGHGAIVDLTLAGTRYEVMKAAIDVMSAAPEFDLIVAVAGSSARYHPDLAVRPIVDSRNGPKPLVAFLVPEAPQALALLSAAGVPNFRTPEACADAIAAAFARRAPRAQATPAQAGGTPCMLDELQAYGLLQRIGVAHAPVAAIDADDACPAHGLPYPLAAKVLHADIAHKTDVGGVVLGIQDHAGLLQAMNTISTEVAARRPGTTVERILAQGMVRGVGEVLIGYRLDAQVGPLVMLAAGGVLTEIYRDRSMRLAPVDLDTAREMIGEVKALQALAGYRGKPAGDLDALAQAIVALSGLALLPDLKVAEAEINPLIVRAAGEGVVAVDALVRLA